MKRLPALLFVILAILTPTLPAQEAPPAPKPSAEHQWLHQFVGEWESTATTVAGAGHPEMTCQGQMSMRMLGGLWLVSEAETAINGLTIQAVQTIGYDPAKKKYVGTWIDSVLNYMWHYEGTVDETGKILTLETTGPNFSAGGKMMTFRDTYEFKSPDHIEARSMMQDAEGNWVEFMTAQVHRKTE